MPRSSGAVTSSGEPALAAALADALRAANRDQITAESLTHPVHSYPARMHPATARALVELLVGPEVERGGNPRLVDPFCGSGTTLVEARFAGAAAFGVDANPLAVRVAHAKTWTALRREREQLRIQGMRIADRSMVETKAARRSGYEAPPERKRHPAAEALLTGWFPKHIRRELEFLYSAILARPPAQAELLLVPLSAILHKVSFRASDTDRRKVEKRIARGFPTRLFRDRVAMLCAGLDDLASEHRAPIPEVVLGDARHLPRGWSAEAIVTSPPYAGTYDYAEHHDLRMAFLEIDPKSIQAREIGARRHQGGRAGLHQWRDDTRSWMQAAAAIMGSGRMMAIVVGDSVAGKTAVFADRELPTLAPDTLELAATASQTRAKLGGAERAAFGDHGKREHILLFRRR